MILMRILKTKETKVNSTNFDLLENQYYDKSFLESKRQKLDLDKLGKKYGDQEGEDFEDENEYGMEEELDVKNMLLPSVDDPKLWMVKTKMGQER